MGAEPMRDSRTAARLVRQSSARGSVSLIARASSAAGAPAFLSGVEALMVALEAADPFGVAAGSDVAPLSSRKDSSWIISSSSGRRSGEAAMGDWELAPTGPLVMPFQSRQGAVESL